MLLNVFERLLIRNIVPQIQGWNFGSQESARILLETMFSEKEEETLQIKVGEDGKGVTWKIKEEDGTPIPQEKDCQVSKGLKAKVGKFLVDLQRQEQLGFEHNSLFKKFVDDWQTYLEKE